MKIVTYLLAALLVAALGAAALFYMTTFQPMMTDYQRMKIGIPELDKAKAELAAIKRKEAWIRPAVAALNVDLAAEIKAGKAEVAVTGNGVVINIAEDLLYTPQSKLFARDTEPRRKLLAMLKRNELKGQEIIIGNATEAVQAHGKGRRRVPAKEALFLASERSAEMVKYLVGSGIPPATLAALAFTDKLPDLGFKIKNKKTMIIIGSCPAPVVQKQEMSGAAQKPPVSRPPAAAPAPGVQPKTIPFRPAAPKTK